MAKISVDGKKYEVDEKQNLLHAGLSVGLNIPYFCYHPALGSVGACRQCAVKMFKDEDDDKGKIVMSCMQPVEDGMIISIEDEEVKQFRAQVIEALMNNHPHDCPVCDEGGECHLQDMTVMTGHTYRNNRFPKRTYQNQYLGPFIHHEMNRCIQCYRCVRFYKEYAGGNDLDAFGIHSQVYFGRQSDGVLENEFSGNLVEVCPTGVFTDKSLKQHYTRKWDLTTAPSVCTHCSLGCNTVPGERYGKLRRIRSRFNYDVNGYFLCDRGRYGYEYVNHENRITTIQTEINPDASTEVKHKENVLTNLKNKFNGKKVIGIGSPTASVESNYALKKWVGAENFYAGFSNKEFQLVETVMDIIVNRKVKIPNLRETAEADMVFILGEDITQTAPMLALNLRQTRLEKARKVAEKVKILAWQDHAVRELFQEEKAPIISVTPAQTKLDEICKNNHYASPDEIAQLGYQVAHLLNRESAGPKNISPALKETAESIAEALKNAKNPLIVTGTGLGNEDLLRAAANIVQALDSDDVTGNLCVTLNENNTMGLAMLEGNNLHDIIHATHKGSHCITIENDLYSRYSDEEVDAFLQGFDSVTSIDFMKNKTTRKAGTVLPAGTFAETSGTFVNNEGRAQRFYKVYLPKGDIQESWRWLRDIHPDAQEAGLNWENLDECIANLVKDIPAFKEIQEIAPPASFRINGQKIPREPHRLSGRTSMHANENVHEQKTPEDPDSPLSFSMEGSSANPPASLHSYSWAPGWNSIQALNKYEIEVGGPLHQGGHGKPLFRPQKKAAPEFYGEAAEKIKLKTDELHIVPAYHIFGSERLSMYSSPVAGRAPEPYILMHPETCKAKNLEEGNLALLKIRTSALKLPVKVQNNMAKNIAMVPAGLPDFNVPGLPASGTVTKK